MRTIEPYAISTRDSFWYLAGNDITKSDLRTFRLDRIHGDITMNAKGKEYEIPDGFDLFAHLENPESARIATVDIRKGKAHLLRTKALSNIDLGEWDRITIIFLDVQRFIDLVLWHGDDALIVEPADIREKIIAALNEIVAHHG